MSPIVELRGSIPVALEIYGLPVWSAYLWSVLGNLVPLTLIVWLGEPLSRFFLQKSYFLNRLIAWVFSHTRKAHQSKFEHWGKKMAIITLVATPIPFIGGWTGAIAAFVFGVKLKEAFPLLVAGSLLAGIIVTVISLGVFSLF